MSIRQLTSQDNLSAICEQLAPELWGKDNDLPIYNAANLQKFIDNSDSLFVVAYEGDKIVACALSHILRHPDPTRNSIYVDEIDTHPQHRRKGYATQILRWLQDYARNNGLTEVWLATEYDDNEATNAFYRSLSPDEELKCNLYSFKAKGLG